MNRFKSRLMAVFLLALPLLIGAVLFVTGKVRFNTPSNADFPVRGVDVSHHQGRIDWPLVKKNGLQFAFIKATEGGDFRDPAFLDNWTGAGRAGFARGAYHFYTLCRPVEDQIRHFIQVAPTDGELPPVVDLEFGGNCGGRPSREAFEKDLNAFLARVDAHFGKKTILYTTYDFIDAYLSERMLERPIWIRDILWKPKLPYGKNWLFWQHHNRGRAEGVDGPLDLNVFSGNETEFRAFMTGNSRR